MGEMEKVRNKVMKTFDVRKLRDRCNYPPCDQPPTKEVLISEFTLQRDKEIASVYVCGDHIKESENLARIVKEMLPDKIIRSQVKDI